MKHLMITVAIFSFAIPAPTIAGQAEYDDCVLAHLKGTKLDLVAHLIKQACKNNYKNHGLTSKREIDYNNCLLKHLVGIESIQAAMEVKSACGRKHK